VLVELKPDLPLQLLHLPGGRQVGLHGIEEGKHGRGPLDGKVVGLAINLLIQSVHSVFKGTIHAGSVYELRLQGLRTLLLDLYYDLQGFLATFHLSFIQ